jgi:small subunit ribosomal protein S16
LTNYFYVILNEVKDLSFFLEIRRFFAMLRMTNWACASFFQQLVRNSNLEIVFNERGEHMAVKIRLKRMGTHKKPYYRLVVADSRSPRDGRFIEMVGIYDPLKKPAEIKVDQTKALDWLKKGAVPSDTVRTLLSKVGIMKQFAEAAK